MYRTSIRLNKRIKGIIEKTFREVCKKTKLRLSYGRVARAFWLYLADDPALRRRCLDLVCKKILLEEADKKAKKGRCG